MAEQTAADQSAAPAPPPTHRRPRVREVSSRFMSPLIQTPVPNPNPLSDLPRSKSAHRRQPSKTDENHVPETNRGQLDKSPAKVIASTVQRKQHHQQRVKHHSSGDHQHFPEARVSSRPDTPLAIGADRVVPSRYRQAPNSTVHRSNSLNSSSSSCSTVTAAARLLQEATSDVEKRLSRISTPSSGDDKDSSNQGSSSCPNSPLCVVPANKAARSGTDVRSSMSDVDKWLAENNNNSLENCGRSTGDCARSLNFSAKIGGGGVSRPPHPSACVRSGLEVRKGRKVSNHQEDVHSLKMLSNHYIQWRFANAKAEASNCAQKHEVERKLCTLGSKISDIRENVKKKRLELAVLQRIKTLTMVVEAQMPYLDEWSCLEEDYSSSLSGTTNALLSSSLRVPVSAEVRADPGELSDALSSALKVVELISCHIQKFIPKAEEMNISITELARMAGGEKSRIEECGDLLSRTYTSQLKECSLRGTLMQLHQNHHHFTSEEQKVPS